MNKESIFHLVPARYYSAQPANVSYRPEGFEAEGFIHCTAGFELLLEIANAFFAGLSDDLLAIEIDPSELTAPLKFEPPIPPPGTKAGPNNNLLFPHIYGPLNPEAITDVISLARDPAGRWHLPPD